MVHPPTQPGTHLILFNHKITASSTCQVMLQSSQTEGRCQHHMCLEQGVLTEGQCPEQPAGNPGVPILLSVSDARAENLTASGVTISSMFLANRDLPEHTGGQNVSVRTELRCADGQTFEQVESNAPPSPSKSGSTLQFRRLPAHFGIKVPRFSPNRPLFRSK